MTLSKVLKKLPNYIKHYEVIQTQAQWQAVKCTAFEWETSPSTSPVPLKLPPEDLLLHKWQAVKPGSSLSGSPIQVLNLWVLQWESPFCHSLGDHSGPSTVVTEPAGLKTHY